MIVMIINTIIQHIAESLRIKVKLNYWLTALSTSVAAQPLQTDLFHVICKPLNIHGKP